MAKRVINESSMSKRKCKINESLSTKFSKRQINESFITKIRECQTFSELSSLKSQYGVVGVEKSVVFEKTLELIGRLLEEEAQYCGPEFTTNRTYPWGLHQRQQFGIEWEELVNSWYKASNRVDQMSEIEEPATKNNDTCSQNEAPAKKGLWRFPWHTGQKNKDDSNLLRE